MNPENSSSLLKFFLLMIFFFPVLWWDLRYFQIPNLLTLGGWAGFFLFSLAQERSLPLSCLLGTAAALAVYLPVYYLFPGKLGGGDVKLACFVGAVTGPFLWFWAHLFSVILGLSWFLVTMKAAGRKKAPVPFGPFLCAGGMAALLFLSGTAL